ncbi:hypothetical protein [Ramlibacter sp.]|uniref:hypothetical protein n=1 Tax=Ramlibacter sp. TaxID=1917967 RepID=UPI002C4A77EC|nr:hypothetical protein [Ramlibacter sp.]HWI82037.1 hypothetical protein [Ramlibacter sp.]
MTRLGQGARALVALALAGGGLAAQAAGALPAETIDTSAANLMVVLRESAGANKQDEALAPYGRLQGTTADGRRVEFETSWYQYLGDMHIRLVFEGSKTLQSASPDDLARLRLSPDQALRLAVANLRRLHGAPVVQPWTAGLMEVRTAAPELTSSYFLDREFWASLQAGHPEGLVVAVPRRGGLVYASAHDEAAVASLRFSVAALYAGGPGARLSSGLYLFKDGRWSVFQAPQPAVD